MLLLMMYVAATMWRHQYLHQMHYQLDVDAVVVYCYYYVIAKTIETTNAK
jgi:hypothetical protein